MTEVMKRKLDKFDVGMSMHTALRKCCDKAATENITEALRHLVMLMTFPDWCDPWLVFCELVAERLPKLKPREAMMASRGLLPDEFFQKIKDAKDKGVIMPDRCERAMWALWYCLRCLDDDDLESMGQLL